MTLGRQLTEDEYQRDWKPLRDRLFPDPEAVCDFPQVSPFGDPTWTMIPLPYILWDGTINVPYGEENSYGLLEFSYSYHDIQFLFLTLKERGIEDILLSNDGLCEPANHWLCPPTWNAVLGTKSSLDAWSVTACSRDGTWGLTSGWEEFSLLGGTPEFIDHYVDNVGGLEDVKGRFFFKDIESMGWPYIGIPQEDIDAFYRMIGWERPPLRNPPDHVKERWARASERKRQREED